MQAQDHCQTPEQVFSALWDGKVERKKSWLSNKKQPDILFQLLQIKAKVEKNTKKYKKKNKNLSPEQLVILSYLRLECVHSYSVPRLHSPLISSFPSLLLCSHRGTRGDLRRRNLAMHCTLHAWGARRTPSHPDDAQNFLSRNHDGSRSVKVSEKARNAGLPV